MKHEKLKETVFKSAWKIVEQKGIAHLNVRAIAKLSNCSLGSIYNCFDNFESLQLHINAAVLSDLYRSLSKVIEKGMEDGKTVREVFRELGAAYIEFGNNHKFLWKALFENCPGASLPVWYRERAQQGIYLLAEKLSAHFKLPKEEMKLKVGFFWASIHGMSAILLNRKMEMVSELFGESSLDSYIDYCLEGLFATEGD